MASCDRYWVKNNKGYWELYSLGKSSPIVDGEYRYVTMFKNGRALVTMRDENVTVIDKNGEIISDLSRIGSYKPDQFTGFNGDVAIFSVNEKLGVCNYKGEMLVKPVYSFIGAPADGKIVATDSIAFNSMLSTDSVEGMRGNSVVFDYKGEELLRISRKKYSQVADRFYGDYIAVGKDRKDGEEGMFNWGILNLKGEEVVKPSSKYSMIGDMLDDMFVYCDGENWGVSKLDGTKILPAKYMYITVKGDYFIASKSESGSNDESDGEDVEMQIFDKKGEKVLPKKYMDIQIFGKNIFVQSDYDKWEVLNLKGERVDDAPKIYALGSYSEGDYYVSTDKIDIKAFVNDLDFSSNTMDGLTFSSSVQNVLKRQSEYYSSTNTPKAADYNNTDEINIYRRIDACSVTETIKFPSKLSHQTYRNEQVIDFWWGWTYYYHINKVPTGYAFTASKPSWFSMSFDNYGILRGKLKTLYKALCDKFADMGTEEEHTGSASCYKLSGGRYAIVYLEDHNVTAKWGTLSASERNVYQYSGNKEDLSVEEADEYEGA